MFSPKHITDMVNYNGTVVHIGKMVDQIKRTEKNYAELEKLYADLLKQNADLQKDHSKSSSKIKDLQAETKSLSKKLADTDHDLNSMNVSNLYYTMKQIRCHKLLPQEFQRIILI